MNRRTFLKKVGYSASVLPWLVTGRLPTGAPTRIRYEHFHKVHRPMVLSRPEEEILGAMKPHTRNPCYLGGPVLAKFSSDSPPPWINLLVQATQWTKLKEALFQFGVQPISTPEMPSNFIKFEHREIVFNVIDGEVDDICHRNSMLSQRGLIPFAHNFLVHELDGHQVYDPRQSLQQVDEDGRFVIQLLREPRNPLVAFDYMLGSRFECGLLNLKPCGELTELGEYILQSRVAESESKFITERFLNYFPDLVELYGYGEVRSILVSPLVSHAVRHSLKLDPNQLDKRLEAIQAEQGEVRDYTVLAQINEALGYKPAQSDFTKNIDHYMLANAFQVRRVDLMKHLV